MLVALIRYMYRRPFTVSEGRRGHELTMSSKKFAQLMKELAQLQLTPATYEHVKFPHIAMCGWIVRPLE